MSFGEIVVGGKCCRGKSGNPRMCESVRCDAVLRYVVIYCTFFRFVILSKAKDLSSAVGRDKDYSCSLKIKASRGL